MTVTADEINEVGSDHLNTVTLQQEIGVTLSQPAQRVLLVF